MENATKALLIAGGVLIAIIIISLFVMMYGKVTNMQKAQEQKTEMEQLLAFNAEYEAYDKKVMYGADVITVMNKAIENNRTKSASTGEINYINIHITINSTFQSTVDKENKSARTGVEYDFRTNEAAADFAYSRFGITISKIPLSSGLYDLGTWKNGEVIENSAIVNWFRDAAKDSVDKITKIVEETEGGKKQIICYYITSGLSDFKTHLFTCESSKTKYDENGRITDMYFSEK